MMEGSETETTSLLRVRIEDDNNSYGSVAVIDAQSRPSPNDHSISKQYNGIFAKGPRSPERLSDYDPIEFDLDRAAIRLSWQGVTVTLPPKSRRCCDVISRKKGDTGEGYAPKQILTNVSGIAEPGTLLAILGASGAGKSTLLNVLNSRNTRSFNVSGDIRVNGVTIGTDISAVSGYVQQDDMFIGYLTTEEHLIFQAMLRMDNGLTNTERRQRVNDVMIELGLTNCAKTTIGIQGKIQGISGGERKRLAFASEVLTNPGLLFCDEPTSGLDSFMAENVVRSLKNLTAQGRTVICTIHQPSSQVNALFDRVLYMAEGRVAYHGPASEISDFFNRAGYVCPPNFNPSDHYIQTLAILPGREQESRLATHAICSIFEDSVQHQEVVNKIHALSERSNADMAVMVKAMSARSRYRASFGRQIIWVLWRSWITVARTPSLTRSRLFQAIVSGLLFGLIYLGQVWNQKGVMNINGALFLLLQQSSFGSVFPVVNTFPMEYPVLLREHHDATYRTSVYFICKSLAELPTFIVIPIIFTGITYFMIGLYESFEAFFILTGTLILVTNVSVSYGYMISCVSSNLNVILALAPMTLIPLMLFGGLFLNNGSVPIYFIWLRYISWFSYSNEIVVVNQWKHVTNITCEALNEASTTSTFSSILATVMLPVPASSRCYKNGLEVIESLGYHQDNVYFDFIMLCVLLVAFRIIAFVLLYVRSRRRQ